MKARGEVVASGIAVGRAALASDGAVATTVTRDAASERARLDEARGRVDAALKDAAAEVSGPMATILDAQRAMLSDAVWWESVVALVGQGATAEEALAGVAEEWAEAFAAMDDEALRARGEDFGGMIRRLLAALRGDACATASLEGRVLIAQELDVLDVLDASSNNVAGVLVVTLSAYGHAAIALKSLAIPALRVSQEALGSLREGDVVIVDAIGGELSIAPTSAEVASARRRIAALSRSRATASSRRGARALETRNGHRVSLLVSVDAAVPQRNSSLEDGVGLLRTELALASIDPLDFDHQREVYAAWNTALGARRLVVRAFDTDADKPLPPSLRPWHRVWPRIWEMKALPPPLHAQLASLMAVATSGDVRYLLPRVDSPAPLVACSEWMRAIAAELAARDMPHRPLPVGAMVESTSAATAVRSLAEAADFLAVGTSDLASSVLGVPRARLRRGALLEPRVLDTLARIREDVPSGRDLWLCGAGLADPDVIETLVGVGYRTFAVDLASAERASRSISNADTLEAAERAESIRSGH